MSTNNVFEFLLKENEKEKIFNTFCVKVEIFLLDGTTQRKFYCLHCRKLYSRSGFDRHKRRKNISPRVVHLLADHFFKNIKMHEMKVKTLLEELGSKGLIPTTIQPGRPHFFTLPPLPPRPTRPRVHQRVQRTVERSLTDEEVQQELPELDRDSGQDPVFTDDRSDFPDLLNCFSSDGFDPCKFDEFTRDF